MKNDIIHYSENKLDILVSKKQCVFYPIDFHRSNSFGKECAYKSMFRLLRRILKQFRINMAG